MALAKGKEEAQRLTRERSEDATQYVSSNIDSNMRSIRKGVPKHNPKA
jgi:hypothetical protein